MSSLVSVMMASPPSLPSREAWIEIADYSVRLSSSGGSLPSREAWIEILGWSGQEDVSFVASLAGSVD